MASKKKQSVTVALISRYDHKSATVRGEVLSNGEISLSMRALRQASKKARLISGDYWKLPVNVRED